MVEGEIWQQKQHSPEKGQSWYSTYLFVSLFVQSDSRPMEHVSHILGLGPSEKKFKDAQRCHCVITNSVKLSISLTTTGVGRSARKRLRNEKCYFYRRPRGQNSVTEKKSTFKRNWKCSLPVCLARHI